MNLYMSIG